MTVMTLWLCLFSGYNYKSYSFMSSSLFHFSLVLFYRLPWNIATVQWANETMSICWQLSLRKAQVYWFIFPTDTTATFSQRINIDHYDSSISNEQEYIYDQIKHPKSLWYGVRTRALLLTRYPSMSVFVSVSVGLLRCIYALLLSPSDGT